MPKLKNLLRFNKYWFLAIFLLLVYVLVFTKVITYHSLYPDNTTNITGKITSFNINGNKLSLELKAREKLKATYYIQREEEKENLQNNLCIGCSISLEGNFSDLINNTVPNTFNYKKYLYNQKIYRSFAISKYKVTKDNNFWAKLKNYFYQRCEKNPNRDYLKIFILGDKSLISSEEYSMFQENGVAHLLAISGMHIGVFLKILDLLLKKLKPFRKLIVITSILCFYAYLTNFAASILRAVIFYVLLSLKKILKIKMSNFKVLLLTAFIILIFNPFFIYNIGFLYSFVITGGIILSNKFIKGSYFKQLLLISIISFLFSLPITLNLNYEINLTSILANLLFVPFISLIVYPISLLTFILPIFSPIFNVLILVLNFFNKVTNAFSFFIILPKMNYFFIFLYYGFLILSLHNKKWGIGILLILILLKILPKLDANYYVFYLDVGQGDCSVLISPYQKEVVMIDTGGKVSFDQEEWMQSTKKYYLSDNTLTFLKSLGINKIDYLIISHGDNDHAGEAIHIINNFKVKNLILNNDSYNDIEQEIIKIKKPTPKLKLKYFSFHNLNNKMYDNENDNSLVLFTSINNFGFLYMGDASKIVEEDILNNYQLNVHFLKLGHHGSNTSSSEEFIKNLNFKYGIISSGRNNRYNHPSPETIATLNKYQKKYFNTQTSGTVMVKIMANAYTIKEYKP